MNDLLRAALGTDRGLTTLNELNTIRAYQGGDKVDPEQFRQALQQFVTRHNGQSMGDALNDNLLRGDTMTADDDYMEAVHHLSKLYSGMADGGSRLSRADQQRLLTQAEQVTYADLDSLVERQGGTDPELFRPTEENTGLNPEDNPNYVPIGDEKATETAVARDPNIAAPLDEGTEVSTYTAGPGAEQVAAGNALGLGHKDTGADSTLRQAQQAIFDGGHYGEGATADEVDGFFGPKTEAATRAWQEANGLDVTGRIGAEDLAELGLAPEGTETATTPRTDRDATLPEVAVKGAEVEDVDGTNNAPESRADVTRMAIQIRNDITGLGNTDYQGISRQLLDMSPSERQELADVYPTISGGESLEDAMRGDWSANENVFRDDEQAVLVGLLNNNPPNSYSESDAVADADALNTAMHGNAWYSTGFGTDEDTVTSIMTGRSPAQIREIAAQYQAMTGESLRGQIEGETTLGYQQALMAIFDNAGVD